MSAWKLSIATMAGLMMCACSETALLRSEPTGAKVFIDGQAAGQTPFPFKVKRSDIREYNVRIEKEGYEPIGDIISPRIAPGRAVGAFFTVGILYLFRSPYYLSAPASYSMSPSLAYQRDENRREQDRVLGEALRSLDELHRNGHLTDEEFNRRRDRLLHPPQ